MSIKFLYFDLGIVLVDFSIEQMLDQIAKVTCISAEQVNTVIFDGGLQHEYELGHISTRDYYDHFCRITGTKPPFDDLLHAANEIFTLNYPMIALVAQLRQAGWPLGILSNTCEGHWQYCFEKYSILTDCFQVYALSCKIGAAKPNAAIFHTAAEMAGCKPEEIFFVDDIAGHVAGAKSVGIDAVQYISVPKFVEDLRNRGMKINY